MEVNLTFLLCFTLYLRIIFQEKPPGGLYLEGRFNGVFFLRYPFGGLIFGGAYFRNFTVVDLRVHSNYPRKNYGTGFGSSFPLVSQAANQNLKVCIPILCEYKRGEPRARARARGRTVRARMHASEAWRLTSSD